MTRPVQLVQFQHSVLREVAHLPTKDVSRFIAEKLVMNESSGNVSTTSGRFVLDAINATLHTAYALREGREGRNALRHTNHAQVPCSRYDSHRA